MVKLIRLTGLMLIISWGQSFSARTPPPSGSLFSIAATGNVLNVQTTVPKMTYYNIGIKVNTPGFALKNAGVECIPADNGYCLFQASDTLSAQITITGPIGAYAFSLCLNGVESRYSCQDYTQTIPGVTIGGTIIAIPINYTASAFIFQNNGKDNLSLTPDPNAITPEQFTFSQSIPYGSDYSVILISQAPLYTETGVTCTIDNSTGSNVTMSIANIDIACIGAIVSCPTTYTNATDCNQNQNCSWNSLAAICDFKPVG